MCGWRWCGSVLLFWLWPRAGFASAPWRVSVLAGPAGTARFRTWCKTPVLVCVLPGQTVPPQPKRREVGLGAAALKAGGLLFASFPLAEKYIHFIEELHVPKAALWGRSPAVLQAAQRQCQAPCYSPAYRGIFYA